MSAPDSSCKKCSGSGMVPAPPDPPHPPRHTRCSCVLRRDVLANVERGMTGLTKAPVVKQSPLLDKHDSNLWITAGSSFLAHLRHVAVRQPATWFLRVTSDAELVTAWLASVALKGGDIIDPDAYMVSTKHLTITDLVTPPDLLVIRMGVKVARNQAASEVLAEALNERRSRNQPTWVWDEPSHPLNAGHLFWSDAVRRVLSVFDRTELKDVPSGKARSKTKANTSVPKKRSNNALGGRKTLRGGGE